MELEKVFPALADKNRRKIIELLYEKDATLLELTDSFSVSFQALSKHIKILEDAKIVRKEKKGKYRIISLNTHALKSSFEWISHYSNFWNESFDKLDQIIRNQKHNDHD
ncbi:ArsR/SmtB family transcription factor [Spongiimicrobium sp. 3-5]|uniref:ArsR/SmtB family transcription factor n=1 Tax=Spongiimicrobium sp. 3-5 TaxID=3332596 RepID=UPI00397F787B